MCYGSKTMKELIDFSSLDEVFGLPPTEPVLVDWEECCDVFSTGVSGMLGRHHTEEHKQNMSRIMKSKNLGYRGGGWHKGQPRPEETRKKISETLKANTDRHTIDTKGCVWVNDGTTNILCSPEEIPEGFVRGRKGKSVWVNDGTRQRMVPSDNIPVGFTRGRL